jgi:hypothetical protein
MLDVGALLMRYTLHHVQEACSQKSLAAADSDAEPG